MKIGAQIIIYIKIKIHKKKICVFILVMIPISHTRLYLNIFQTKNVQTRTCHKQKASYNISTNYLNPKEGSREENFIIITLYYIV